MSNQIAFMCLHAGPTDRESVEVLDIIRQAGLINYIIPIDVTKNKQTKNLLLYNTSGVSVTELPSIVVAQGQGVKPQVYPGKSINTIIDDVRSIIMN